jgi:S1-C subfamily serine protease
MEVRPSAAVLIREHAKDSIVFLRRITRQLDGSDEVVAAAATGFIVSPEGYLITTAHLLKEKEGIETFYYAYPGPDENTRWGLSVFKSDMELDVALLKLLPPRQWKALPIASSTKLLPDTSLFTLGFPLGLNLSSGKGILSSKSSRRGSLFQTTLPLNLGSSGSPVFNHDKRDGRVIGVAAGGIDQANGVTYVIPSNHLRNLLQVIDVEITESE